MLPTLLFDGRRNRAFRRDKPITGATGRLGLLGSAERGAAVEQGPDDRGHVAGASSPGIIAPMMTPAPDIDMRPAVAADAARVRDLTRAAYAKWAALIGREPLPMQADYERALREHAIDLLTVGGVLAGLIALYAKLGYTIERAEPFRGGTAVRMSKRIGAQ
jgi:hypothetical protein